MGKRGKDVEKSKAVKKLKRGARGVRMSRDGRRWLVLRVWEQASKQ